MSGVPNTSTAASTRSSARPMIGERQRRIILRTKPQEAKMDQNTCYECMGVVSTFVRTCPHCGAQKPGNGVPHAAYMAGTQSRELPEALDWAVSKGNTQAVKTFLKRSPIAKRIHAIGVGPCFGRRVSGPSRWEYTASTMGRT